MSELKPCPFCGGEAKLKHIGNEFTKKRSSVIECKTFGCFGMQKVGTINNTHIWCDGKVIERWNTRPLEDALQAKADMCDRLAETLNFISNITQEEIERRGYHTSITMLIVRAHEAMQAYNELKEKNDG